MTVHDLHDALNLLPADLITAADRLRTAPKAKVIPLRRWISLAACLVLVLSTAMVFRQKIQPAVGGKSEAAAEAPAAMMESRITGDTTQAAAEMEAAAPEDAPAEDSAGSNSADKADEKGIEEEIICIDHSHRFAEETKEDEPAVGYCGNMMTTIYLEDQNFTLEGSDSIAIADILINLDYDPDEVCRCMTEFTVDTEMLAGIQVSLGQGFARCEKGQAALTEKQAQTIQEIIDRLQ